MNVSIIIPTLNSGRTLDRCLGALVGLDYPRDEYEIIVKDHGCLYSPTLPL
jgi:glycosyltransferase involved in cell wall biosynthesis